MPITAQIVEDTLSSAGVRLTTFSLRYPRFIHAEFMTHRVFSRNASSSRAIPVGKTADEVLNDMAEPVSWGKNQAGMQARQELSDIDRAAAQAHWRIAGRDMARVSRDLAETGAHKQIANRVSEPWQHICVVVTATDFDNFFLQRCHRDADPTMQELAWAMAHRYYAAVPKPASDGWCHLPFVSAAERLTLPPEQLLSVSVARCARVSYKNHDGSFPVVEKDIQLATDLATQGHWSPFEHQAFPLSDSNERSGNFRGWRQYRQLVMPPPKRFDYLEAVGALQEANLRVPGRTP
jgi:thymidylate synthase ThyX